MPKTVTIRIDDDTYRSFVRRAKAENRSLGNFIETAVTEHMRECDFADDSEMTELLANADLIERLQKGSRDAKKKKGTLIG